jgi:hypothetical protein
MRIVIEAQATFGGFAAMAGMAMLFEQWPNLLVEVNGLAVGEYGQTKRKT